MERLAILQQENAKLRQDVARLEFLNEKFHQDQCLKLSALADYFDLKFINDWNPSVVVPDKYRVVKK